MQPSSQQLLTCPTCGAALEETFGGGGGCMFCLLQAGIGSEMKPAAARVAKLETRLGTQTRQSLEYYWAGKRVVCLVSANFSPDFISLIFVEALPGSRCVSASRDRNRR